MSESLRYRLFAWTVALTSLPLLLVIYLFFDSPKWGWVAHCATVLLIVFGLVGGIRGFQIYVAKRAPTPLNQVRKAVWDWGHLVKYLRPKSMLVDVLAFLIAAVAASISAV